MTATTSSVGGRSRGRRRVAPIALIIGALVAIAPAPAALAATALAAADAPVSTAGSGGAAAVSGEQDPSASFAEIRALLAQFEATGEVTLGGAGRLRAVLDLAEIYHVRGFDFLAVMLLETFKDVANDPLKVPGESAQAALTAAADELIALLGG